MSYTIQIDDPQADIIKAALEGLIRNATVLHGSIGAQINAQIPPPVPASEVQPQEMPSGA